MMRSSILVPILLLSAAAIGCGERENLEEQAVSDPAPPPASAIAPVRESVPLSEMLDQLAAELSGALEVGDGMSDRLLRAEAVTDRLLTANLPYAWLAEDYALEARLRQIQSQADRVVAELRRGVADTLIVREIEALQRQVQALDRAIAQGGGGEAPPPLDSLLAAGPQREDDRRSSTVAAAVEDTTDAAETEAETEEEDEGPRLLGRPVERR